MPVLSGTTVNRVLTTFLVVLALAGVVSGNLFRPCDCSADEESGARSLCHSRVVEQSAPRSCCGGFKPTGADQAPRDGDNAGDDEGCNLCCKPRPPITEAAGSITLADAQAVVIAILDDLPSTAATPARVDEWKLVDERRTCDQWLLSPEGLAVFLI